MAHPIEVCWCAARLYGAWSRNRRSAAAQHRYNSHEKIVIFAGGVPIKMSGTLVGAVGASGGTVEQDQQVVEAATGAFRGRR
jgi:uncharacterized protein GlcG (DUF336 family)